MNGHLIVECRAALKLAVLHRYDQLRKNIRRRCVSEACGWARIQLLDLMDIVSHGLLRDLVLCRKLAVVAGCNAFQVAADDAVQNRIADPLPVKLNAQRLGKISCRKSRRVELLYICNGRAHQRRLYLTQRGKLLIADAQKAVLIQTVQDRIQQLPVDRRQREVKLIHAVLIQRCSGRVRKPVEGRKLLIRLAGIRMCRGKAGESVLPDFQQRILRLLIAQMIHKFDPVHLQNRQRILDRRQKHLRLALSGNRFGSLHLHAPH